MPFIFAQDGKVINAIDASIIRNTFYCLKLFSAQKDCSISNES
jgi:hypothetical protein